MIISSCQTSHILYAPYLAHVTSRQGNVIFHPPVEEELTFISYAIPNMLPQERNSLFTCKVIIFKQSGIEAHKVKSDREGFEGSLPQPLHAI